DGKSEQRPISRLLARLSAGARVQIGVAIGRRRADAPMIAAIVTALLAVAAGLPFTRRIGEAYLLGIGIQAAMLIVLPWSRPVLIIAMLLECGALAPLLLRRYKSGGKPPHSIIDLLTLVLIAGYARFATMAPPTEIDFICIWGLKAQEFLVAHGIDWNF